MGGRARSPLRAMAASPWPPCLEGLNRHRLVVGATVLAAVLFPVQSLPADEIRVAVASSFARTMTALAGKFEAETGHKVVLSSGSTGKHYAQILNGAPFDLFFAADSERPALLEEQGLVVATNRFTYARGKLVLWSPRDDFVDGQGRVLEGGNFRFLAIANPRLAPYGKAAREVLEARGRWEELEVRMVRGENVGQAYQFVKTGNAELGFVALAQVLRPGRPVEGSMWEVPPDLYEPIDQQAVLLKDHAAARAFLAFVRSDAALKIILEYGYIRP